MFSVLNKLHSGMCVREVGKEASLDFLTLLLHTPFIEPIYADCCMVNVEKEMIQRC